MINHSPFAERLADALLCELVAIEDELNISFDDLDQSQDAVLMQRFEKLIDGHLDAAIECLKGKRL